MKNRLCITFIQIFYLLVNHSLSIDSYKIPAIKIDVLNGRGFEVSMPAQRGDTSFEFHGKLNEPFTDDMEYGPWYRRVTRKRQGRFTYTDRRARLQVNDTLYYRVEVIHDGQSYTKNDGKYVIGGYAASSAAQNIRSRPRSFNFGNLFKLDLGAGGTNGTNGTRSFSIDTPILSFNSDGAEGNGTAPTHRNTSFGIKHLPNRADEATDAVDEDVYYTQNLNNIFKTQNGSPHLGDGSGGVQLASRSFDCADSLTVVNGNKVECEGDLLFEETFETATLDASKWTIENRFSTAPDFEFVMYFKDSNALKIEQSMAKIKPYRLLGNDANALYTKAYDFGPSCTGQLETEECTRTDNDFSILPPLVSAQMSTKDHFRFKYGRIEVRARLPNADWVIPQLTLEPASFNHYGKSDYQSGQMRIAFTEGSTTCTLKGGVLLNSEQPIRTAKMCSKQCLTDSWSQNFHIYSLTWTARGVKLRVDGEEYCSIDPQAGFAEAKFGKNNLPLPNAEHLRKGTQMAPFDQEFYLKLGYGVAGLGDFSDEIMRKPWNNADNKPVLRFWKVMRKKFEWLNNDASELQIDYVRVYSV